MSWYRGNFCGGIPLVQTPIKCARLITLTQSVEFLVYCNCQHSCAFPISEEATVNHDRDSRRRTHATAVRIVDAVEQSEIGGSGVAINNELAWGCANKLVIYETASGVARDDAAVVSKQFINKTTATAAAT